eukprot:Amastigsp_a5027_28.p2 type:complete len:158 gc:universal Amastigsp_a5027_28:443-916(+)
MRASAIPEYRHAVVIETLDKRKPRRLGRRRIGERRPKHKPRHKQSSANRNQPRVHPREDSDDVAASTQRRQPVMASKRAHNAKARDRQQLRDRAREAERADHQLGVDQVSHRRRAGKGPQPKELETLGRVLSNQRRGSDPKNSVVEDAVDGHRNPKQ